MSTKNDALIAELTQKIKDKKAALKGIDKFVPITNCSLDWNGARHNLHTLNTSQLELLLVGLHAYQMSAADLGIGSPTFSLYTVDEWVSDIKAKLLISRRKEEEAKLSAMEKSLEKLMSEDARTEKELARIMSELGEK